MSNLAHGNNPATFPDVYQIEQGDAVDAGVAGAGISNLQAKQLLERGDFLKALIEANGGPVVVITTGTTTLTVADISKKIISDGVVTLNLPEAATCPNGSAVLLVNKADDPSDIITVARHGSDTIEGVVLGATSAIVYAGFSTLFYTDGSAKWYKAFEVPLVAQYDEPWRVLDGTGTFLNGESVPSAIQSDGFRSQRMRKLANGMVQISGSASLVDLGVTNYVLGIVNLPLGYRPAEDHYSVGHVLHPGGGSVKECTLHIGASGTYANLFVVLAVDTSVDFTGKIDYDITFEPA